MRGTCERCRRQFKNIGVWRSWLAHLHGVQGVVCSSHITPTIENQRVRMFLTLYFFALLHTICIHLYLIHHSEDIMLIKNAPFCYEASEGLKVCNLKDLLFRYVNLVSYLGYSNIIQRERKFKTLSSSMVRTNFTFAGSWWVVPYANLHPVFSINSFENFIKQFSFAFLKIPSYTISAYICYLNHTS
jgi:hypothetical protein